MNSNRMKYASTPTYGMQKRNYQKKQAAAQTTPTPDFTQQPVADPSTPLSPFPQQTPFMMPPGAFPGVASQQTNPMFFGSQSAMPPQMMPNMPPPQYAANLPLNSYNNMMPQQQTPTMPLYQQPMGGAVPQPQNPAFSTRSQGFVPQTSFPQGNNAMPPNVTRSDAYSSMNTLPGGGNPGTMNGGNFGA